MPHLQKRHRQIDSDSHVLGLKLKRRAVFLQSSANISLLFEIRAAIVQLDRRDQVLVGFVSFPQQFREPFLCGLSFLRLAILPQCALQGIER